MGKIVYFSVFLEPITHHQEILDIALDTMARSNVKWSREWWVGMGLVGKMRNGILMTNGEIL